MVRFMKGVHNDIRITFSNFYLGMVRPYHGTTPGVMFFKHLFHFFVYQVNDAFMVDYILPHISSKYMSIPCKGHENLVNGTSIVF